MLLIAFPESMICLRCHPLKSIRIFDVRKLDKEDFCNHMSHRGWAVVRSLHEDEDQFKKTLNCATEFFSLDKEKKMSSRVLFAEVDHHSSGLSGYNEPHPGKQLFRIRKGLNQPFPEEPLLFRSTVEDTFERLERVMAVCCGAVLADCGAEYSAIVQERDDPPNCNEHVDPGWMTCVVVSGTPGLEVLDASTGDWLGLEHFLIPFQHIIVMRSFSEDKYVGAVHRVIRNDRERMSLVYERRPPTDAEISSQKRRRF
ncbi:hypothetical protein PROFUN_08056 [Planoprotostelium fungivorum]|uniref:Isopenicillin N synthase-like Fe(2+) 2OG dioxygenase domain-containing protein n=1 Tax=Planoprotostelium fungivorum TaxID=1890364 RepID=A0A2P6NKI6_9EUKA|nr:hypothetical protein PROFUN_08056 [Planoprotostelium fungivorum]